MAALEKFVADPAVPDVTGNIILPISLEDGKRESSIRSTTNSGNTIDVTEWKSQTFLCFKEVDVAVRLAKALIHLNALLKAEKNNDPFK